MPADTVTLDREAVMDLLVEAEAVADALSWLAGSSPTPLADELERKVARVADELLGEWPERDEEGGPRVELNDAGLTRGRELLEGLLADIKAVDDA